VLSTIAAAGITRGAISGFTHAFTVATVIAVVAAAGAALLVPAGKAQLPEGTLRH